jgi:CRP/FNR family transcriptional activator FtrB
MAHDALGDNKAVGTNRTMINEDDEAAILATPFFSRLSRESRDRLLAASYVQHFAAGSILYRRNDQCNFAFIALDGSIAWIAEQGAGKEWVIEFVPPGELMGLLAIRVNKTYIATGRVIENTRVLLIPAVTLRECLETDLRCALAALDTLAVRVPRLTGQIRELKAQSAAQRLAGFILELIDSNGSGRKEGEVSVTLPWSRSLIATRLGIVPESMSRVFAELKDYGVEGRGARLSVHSVQQLRDLVQTNVMRGKVKPS